MAGVLVSHCQKGEDVEDSAQTNITFAWTSKLPDRLVTSTDA